MPELIDIERIRRVLLDEDVLAPNARSSIAREKPCQESWEPKRDRPEIIEIGINVLIDALRSAYDDHMLEQQLAGYEPRVDAERFLEAACKKIGIDFANRKPMSETR